MNENVNYMSPVAQLSVEDRSTFIWKCYAHVIGAILVFAAIEVYFFRSGIAEAILEPMINNWWMVLGAFILGGWGATHVAHRVQSKNAQYAAFAGFIVLEALIFAPMLYLAYTQTAWRYRQRRRRDDSWQRWPYCHRYDYAQGFLLPERHAGMGIHAGNGGNCRLTDFRLPFGYLVLCGHDRLRGCGRSL